MDKLLKYCLSLIILLIVYSCKEKASLGSSDKRLLAEEIYKKSELFGQGNPDFMTGIEKAIKVDPTFDKGIRELSVPYLKRGMPHLWKPNLDKAVALNPERWLGYRGNMYLWFYRDYKKALLDYDSLDKLTPDFVDVFRGYSINYWRGLAYLGLNDYKKTTFYFDKYIDKEIKDFSENSVEISAFLYKGIAYFESNNLIEAENCFTRLLRNSEGHSGEAKYYLALTYKKQNKITKAKKMIDLALEDFNSGYVNKRDYVEVLRQLYLDDYKELKSSLEKPFKS